MVTSKRDSRWHPGSSARGFVGVEGCERQFICEKSMDCFHKVENERGYRGTRDQAKTDMSWWWRGKRSLVLRGEVRGDGERG